MIVAIILLVAIVAIVASGVRIVRPTQKMLIETFGKYTKTAEPGLNIIIPIVQRGIYANITEQMVDVRPQTVITKDKLNAVVDAVVYYKIKDAKKAAYNVDNHKIQLTSLARTTLRSVIGKMTLTEANENRDTINQDVETVLDKETDSYGVEVLRVEIQKIEPPRDVQDAMNEVVKAEQLKIASKDRALAKEIEADGLKKAYIKEAEGKRQFAILEAEGKAKSFDLIEKSFKGKAQLLKKLEVTENSLKDNSKVIITDKGISPQLIIGNLPTKN